MVRPTRDLSNNFSIYLNGALAFEGVDGAPFTVGSNGVILGRDGRLWADGRHAFTGLFDDFRVYGTALTAREIIELLPPERARIYDFSAASLDDFIVHNTADLWTIEDTNEELRISKAADDGSVNPAGFISGSIDSTFAIFGDFTATVDFQLSHFPPAPLAHQLNESHPLQPGPLRLNETWPRKAIS